MLANVVVVRAGPDRRMRVRPESTLQRTAVGVLDVAGFHISIYEVQPARTA